MPENWPPDNTQRTEGKTPAETVEARKARLHAEIIKLKTEILKEEERIDRIPKWLDKDIAQNALDEKRGRLKMRIDECERLNSQQTQ